MAERALGMRARRLLLTVAGIVLSIATAHRYCLFCAMENGFGPQGQADGFSAGTCEHPRRSIGVVSRAEARIEAADRELATVPHAHNQGDGSPANAAGITTMNLPSAPATKMKRRANQPVVMMAQEPGGVYERAAAGRFDPAVKGALDRVYVPNVLSHSVDVIDPKTLIVIDQFEAGASPQHVVPSWDLRTLWVAGSKVRHAGTHKQWR